MVMVRVDIIMWHACHEARILKSPINCKDLTTNMERSVKVTEDMFLKSRDEDEEKRNVLNGAKNSLKTSPSTIR